EKLQDCVIRRGGEFIAQHKRFDHKLVLAKRGTDPDVGHGVEVCSRVQFYPSDVHASFGQQFVFGFQVERRHSHLTAAPGAADDTALDLEPTAQEPARSGYVSESNQFADVRAAD